MILLAMSLLAALVGPWVMRQIEIDICLDNGGSYNHDNKCIFASKESSIRKV